MRSHTRRRPPARRSLRLLTALAVATAPTTLWATSASASPADVTAAPATVSWQRHAPRAQALPPPHEPERGSCLASRDGLKIRMDCTIKVADTTLWVACSGGFVEIRHLNPPGVTAEGTCPTYGGYALTYTSPD